MPVIKLWCLPNDLDEERLRELHKAVVAAVVGVKELGLRGEQDMITLFPPDMMKYGLGTEIIIEVGELFGKPERTEEVRGRLAQSLGETVKSLFPDAKVVCKLDPPFDPKQGYWVSPEAQGDSEFEERGRLIEQMLDKIYPFSPDMPENIREGVEGDRQSLVLRTGWSSVPIEELRQVAAR